MRPPSSDTPAPIYLGKRASRTFKSILDRVTETLTRNLYRSSDEHDVEQMEHCLTSMFTRSVKHFVQIYQSKIWKEQGQYIEPYVHAFSDCVNACIGR